MTAGSNLEAASEATAEVMTAIPVSMAGVFGGECFRAFCSNRGANWYHARADRFYCAACAAEINHELRLKGEPPACTKR